MEQIVTRKDLRMINYDIFTSVISYLLGPKYNGKFEVKCSNSSTEWNVIRILTGYGLPYCNLYFGDSIRIGVYQKEFIKPKFEKYYTYFNGHIDGSMHFDVDMYTYITKTFLCELIRHIVSVKLIPEYYSNMHWNEDGYIDGGLVKGFDNPPDYFSSYCKTHESLLLYEYSYDDVKLLQYVISCMKSKAFKRSRGDYQ